MDTSAGQRHDATLYELFSAGKWQSEQRNGLPAGASSKDTNGVKSYASVPQRVLRTLAARLVRTLDGLVVSPSVPPALVQLLPLVRPSWSLSPSPCGSFLAVLQEDRIDIRSRACGFEVAASAPLHPDGFPSWRRIAWSPNSEILAVSASNGRIQLLRVDGVLLCAISPKTKAGGSGGSSTVLPTRPVQVDWEALGEGGRNDSVGFIDPISVLFFVDPARDSKTGTLLTYDGHSYTHELLTITYDGILRSYLIHSGKLHSALPARTTTSYVPLMHARRPSSPGLVMLRESQALAGRITFYHKFSFHHWHTCVCSAALDDDRGMLLISGRAVTTARPKQASEEGDPRNLISEWKLVQEKPHYQMKGAEFLETTPSTQMDEDEPTSVWQNLRKVLSVDTVLLSIQPSRRKLYLDTIHCIALSPDGRRLLTLDCNGTLKLWDSERLDMIRQWTTEELRQQLNLAHESNSNVSGQSSRAISPSMTATLISAGWWSDHSVQLAFADGYVAMAELATMRRIAGLEISRFRNMPEVTSFPGDRVLVLECETAPIRMRLRDGVYIPLRTQDGEETSPHESLALVSPRSFLATMLSYASRPLRLFTDTILWHWEDDSSPTQQTVTVIKRQFELHCFLKTTPFEAMQRKIAMADYEAATKLALEHDLSKDDIYKAQWLASEVTEETVSDYLSNIKDRLWVMRTCVERVPSNVKATYLLLRYGLKQTDRITLEDVEKEIEDALTDSGSPVERRNNADSADMSVASLCVFRTRLLKYLNRLETHRAIYGASFDPDSESAPTTFANHFEWFRDSDLVNEAIDLALNENYSALETLFTRHGKDILPYRLSILNFIPETADPTLYKQLLPKINVATDREIEWLVIPWKRADWTETESVQDFVQLLVEGDGDDQEEEEGGLQLHNYPASSSEVTAWYTARACEMEASSGQADMSLDLVRLGQRNNVRGLENLHEDLVTLSTLLYECYDPTSKDVAELSLESLRCRSPSEVLQLFIAQSTAKTIAYDLRTYVLHYLARLSDTRARSEGHDPTGQPSEDAMELLYDWVISISATQLDWCAEIFEASMSSSEAGPRIIKKARIADLVVKCAYNCVRTDQWDVYARLASCLAARLHRAPSAGTASPKRKKAAVSAWESADLDWLDDELASNYQSSDSNITAHRLLVHIESAQILDRYGLAKSLVWLAQADTDAAMQRQLMLLLARQSTGDDDLPPGDEFRFQNEDEWSGLLDHMLRLHEIGILGLIPKKDIYVEFVAVILNGGMFDLAKSILRPERSLPPLLPDVAEKLVINAASEFYDNADSGDMTQGLLKKARDCLLVLPASPDLQAEIDFIQATHQLTVRYNGVSDNGEPILPIQIRLHKNRLHFIEQVLERDPSAHRSREALLGVTRKLLREQYTASQKCLAQALIALAALRDGDWDAAYNMCAELIASTEDPAAPHGAEVVDAICDICLKLGTATVSDDLGKRINMVGHALVRCPASKMSTTLALWSSLESEKIAIDTLTAAGVRTYDEILAQVGRTESASGRWEFDIDKAIDEVERLALAYDDVEDSQANNDTNQGLARPSFYSRLDAWNDLATKTDGEDESGPFVRVALQSLLRLTEAAAVAIDNDVGLERPHYNDLDFVPLDLAGLMFKRDAMLAVGYLLSASEGNSAEQFFRDLPSSPTIELLACYYYLLRGLQDMVLAENPEAVDKLHSCAPGEIVGRIADLAQHCDARLPVSESAKAAITLAARHAQQSRAKEEEHKLRALYDQTSVDITQFETNAEYRTNVVLRMAETMEENALTKCFTLADQVQIPESKVLTTHILWAFEGCDDLQALQGDISWLSARIAAHPSDVVETLLKAHKHIDGKAHGKHVELYTLMLGLLPTVNKAMIESVEARRSILQALDRFPVLRTIDLSSILKSRTKGADHFLAEIGRVRLQSLTELQHFARLLPKILSVEAIPALREEPYQHSLDIGEVISHIHAKYATDLMPSVPWEYLEEQKVAALVSEIMVMLDPLLPKDLLALTLSMTVSESAIGIPAAFRRDLAARAQLVASRHGGGSENIDRHLSMVVDISEIVDETSGEVMAPERVQQFDLSYGQPPKQFASIAMRMIISATAPPIVYKLCQVLCAAFPDHESLFDPPIMYQETALAIMGTPSDPAFEGVFRRGLDSPAAALERILAVVIPLASVSVPRRQAIQQPDSEPKQPPATTQALLPKEELVDEDDGSGWDIGFDELSSPERLANNAVAAPPPIIIESAAAAHLPSKPQPSSTSLPTLTIDAAIDKEGGWDIDSLSPVKSDAEEGSGWDIGLDDLGSPIRPHAPPLDAPPLSLDSTLAASLHPQTAASMHSLSSPAETTDDGEGWDIGGLSPVKSEAAHDSMWDIPDVDYLVLEPPAVPSLQVDIPDRPQALAVPSSQAEEDQEGWGLDLDIDSDHKNADESPVAPVPAENKPLPLPEIHTGATSHPGARTSSAALTPASREHSQKPAIPPFETSMGQVSEGLRNCLNKVVEEPGRFAPDFGMQMFGLLQKYFAIPEVDARKLQSSKVALIIKGAWNLEARNNDLETQEGRQELLQTLLAHTRTPAQAQSLVAVLAEWLPVPQTPASSSVCPVPAYLQVFWKALLCWMIEHEAFEMVVLVRVEFSAYEILDVKAEDIILQTLEDMQQDAERFKHGLLTSHPRILRDTITALHDTLASSAPSPSSPQHSQHLLSPLHALEADRLLHILICARGLATVIAGTSLWRAVRDTLTALDDTQEPPAHHLLRNRVVAELTAGGFASAAAGLRYGAGSPFGGTGDRADSGMLGRIWGFASGSRTQRVITEAEKRTEEKIISRFCAQD
ncbi:hypothetical protein HDU87_001621 [Geranomyces variabilis]|uniref:Sec39 domain-containing protein n=1 Tax=Geranomyces variabilis TaxID=109894 RepID=A0AAD5TMG0_9FUNG|nr:hypothetical protein HDU87_001621 [Geranomyces variabilis]